MKLQNPSITDFSLSLHDHSSAQNGGTLDHMYMGFSGFSGQQGIQGFSGVSGQQGVQGVSGFSGATTIVNLWMGV